MCLFCSFSTMQSCIQFEMHCMSEVLPFIYFLILCIPSRYVRFLLHFYISVRFIFPNWDRKCEVWLVSIFSSFYQMLLKHAKWNFNCPVKHMKALSWQTTFKKHLWLNIDHNIFDVYPLLFSCKFQLFMKSFYSINWKNLEKDSADKYSSCRTRS